MVSMLKRAEPQAKAVVEVVEDLASTGRMGDKGARVVKLVMVVTEAMEVTQVMAMAADFSWLRVS